MIKDCDVDMLDYDRNVGVAAILDFGGKISNYIANVEYNFVVVWDIIKISKVIVLNINRRI